MVNIFMPIIKNKKALHDYIILDKFEAGLVLHGHEVKSIRDGNINLKGSFVSLVGGEAYLKEAHIAQYKKATLPEYDPYRPRKLLLNKKELHKLYQTTSIKGLTIIPVSVYKKGRRIKLEIAIARGKAQQDKREMLKKRDLDRDMKRTLRNAL